MIGLLATGPALPLGKAGKFVAAAYIVVFVIVLVYVAIMATRARRLERELEELRSDVEAARAGTDGSEPSIAGRSTPERSTPGAAEASDGPASAGDPEHSGSLL